jgi:hypothetical protein
MAALAVRGTVGADEEGAGGVGEEEDALVGGETFALRAGQTGKAGKGEYHIAEDSHGRNNIIMQIINHCDQNYSTAG